GGYFRRKMRCRVVDQFQNPAYLSACKGEPQYSTSTLCRLRWRAHERAGNAERQENVFPFGIKKNSPASLFHMPLRTLPDNWCRCSRASCFANSRVEWSHRVCTIFSRLRESNRSDTGPFDSPSGAP